MRISLAVTVLAAFCALSAGCKQRESHPDADASTIDARFDGWVDISGAGGAALKPLALGCSASVECASGFCVDGVCCDAACDGQCSTCDGSGNVGYCTALIAGDDTTSAETCTGAHTCALVIPSMNLQACRLKDLQACNADSDCASLLCVTFYVDHDGDGYGESDTTLKFCEEVGATPPAGYVTQGGDCCDNDSNSYPGQIKFFTAEDACGSWDYNCDGVVETSPSGFSAAECGTSFSTGQINSRETISCN